MRFALLLCAVLGVHASAVNLTQVEAEEICFSNTVLVQTREKGETNVLERPLLPLFAMMFEDLGFTPFPALPSKCKYLLSAMVSLEEDDLDLRVAYELALDPVPFKTDTASNVWIARKRFPFVDNTDTAKHLDAAIDAATLLFLTDWRQSR